MLGGLALRLATRQRRHQPYWAQILTAASALLAAGVATALGGSISSPRSQQFRLRVLRRDQSGEVTFLVGEGGELFNAVTFIIFGAVILGPALNELTWELALYAVLSLTVVRMLPVAVAMTGTGAQTPTLAFLGWFGPRGLASIVFGVILLNDADLPQERTILLAVVVTVGISVFAHGLTARPLTKRYVGWYESHPKEAPPAMEAVPAAEHRSRTPRTGHPDDHAAQ